jgi:hypothetical protein
MRTNRFSILLSLSLVAVLATSAGSCLFSPERVPEGRLTGYEGCKDFLPAGSRTGDGGPGPGWECLEYEYDGRSVLRLKHINAGFNCCPGTISADIFISEGVIRIRERESSALCDCDCLYDLEYEFVHIKPGSYRISAAGPYQREGDRPLEFVVDLDGPVSGSFCVERTHYPWSI